MGNNSVKTINIHTVNSNGIILHVALTTFMA